MVTEEEEQLVGESKTLSQPFLQIKVFCFVCFLENQNNNTICRIMPRCETVFPSSVGEYERTWAGRRLFNPEPQSRQKSFPSTDFETGSGFSRGKFGDEQTKKKTVSFCKRQFSLKFKLGKVETLGENSTTKKVIYQIISFPIISFNINFHLHYLLCTS